MICMATSQKMPMPQWWRDELGAWVAAKRGRRASLAKAVGCDPTLITRMVQGLDQTSELVGPVCDHTGIPYPFTEIHPRLAELVSVAGELREESSLKILEDMARTLADAARNKPK